MIWADIVWMEAKIERFEDISSLDEVILLVGEDKMNVADYGRRPLSGVWKLN